MTGHRFGSLATLVGAYGTWKLRDKKPHIAIIPPIIANLLVVPLILKFTYDVETATPMMLTVGLGEKAACGMRACPRAFGLLEAKRHGTITSVPIVPYGFKLEPR